MRFSNDTRSELTNERRKSCVQASRQNGYEIVHNQHSLDSDALHRKICMQNVLKLMLKITAFCACIEIFLAMLMRTDDVHVDARLSETEGKSPCTWFCY